jgi:hypothetical protein
MSFRELACETIDESVPIAVGGSGGGTFVAIGRFQAEQNNQVRTKK